MLLGTPLVRAGRGRTAFAAAVAFAIFFAASVQYFLFRWPDWMYAYLVSEAELAPAIASAPFFLAVVGMGVAGAFVSLQLVRAGRMGWAVVNVLFGLSGWLLLWAATWDRYFHIGNQASWLRGVPRPLESSPEFMQALNVAGAAQAVVGLGLVAFVILEGRKARRLSTIQPEPASEWRSVLDGPSIAPAPGPSVIREGAIWRSRPIDGAPLEPIPVTPLEELPRMLERARKVQASWAALPVEVRAKRLRLVRQRLLAQAEEAAAHLQQELGRPRAESYFAEILPSADLIGFWTKKGPGLLRPQAASLDPLIFPGKRAVIESLPRGVVGVISPWNFPLAMPLRVIVPALLSGNAVIWKPSEQAAHVAAWLSRQLAIDLPADLLQLVQGGPEAGQALLGVGLDHASFVGSPRTGRAVARAAAEKLTPVSLELGGKDAAVVLPDADLDRAAEGIVWAAFSNAGQSCAAVERCYVHESVAEAFTQRVRDCVAALRVGPGLEGQVEIGPLATPGQKSLVLAQLRQAGIASGEQGQYVAPTVIVDPPADASLLREETFGPVLPIVRVSDDEEIVELVNRSSYALTVSVWSKNTSKAEALGRRLQAGVVTVNNHAFTGGVPQLPFGGVRGSGTGVTNGVRALEELTRPRLVLVDKGKQPREPWWYPYDDAALRLGRAMARFHGPIGGKIESARELLAAFRERRRSKLPKAAASRNEEKEDERAVG